MQLVAVDLGGTRIKTGIIDAGVIIADSIINAAPEKGLAAHLPIIKEQISSLLDKTKISGITAIAMAFPGLVDTVQNKVIDTSGKYEDAPLVHLTEWAQQELGMRLKLENDARMACLGEWKWGAGKGSSDMVMFTLGTGIGSSVIMNGKIVRGKHFQAGVLGGHFIIDYTKDAPRCTCGNFGCAESIASTWRLKDAATKHSLFNKSALREAAKTDYAAVSHFAAKGDALAIELQEVCLQAWSAALINLIHSYDPEVVVIGGGIMHSKDIIIPYFKKTIKERAWCPWGMPEIKPALYPDTAALLGGALLF